MSEIVAPAGPLLPAPAKALQARFEHIRGQQMADLPMLNPALRVEAVGFRPWSAHWLGVLVTPWFMNLMLLPRRREQWPGVAERESRHHVFPAGVFEFIGGHDAVLDEYQACSLFSPMFGFSDHAAAHNTAVAALAALFDAANRPGGDAPPQAPAAPAGPALSKRGFLFGGTARGPHET
ncbi:MAG: [NiFe]-hydrogenase assembly, chaperone, HybE [Leptothrix sp. (in: Bacteria)]|nr:[NiFe]-hydrogenase assembly, chaperone, HybE [Leptothrix sp. (in: b-proteobacteria)]